MMLELPKSLSELQPARIAVKVQPKVERIIRQRHPWIFENGIKKQSKDAKAGDLAIIFDQKKNKLLAIGIFDPQSPIRIKVLEVLQSANINEEWFEAKLQSAYQLRQPLLQTNTNSYRLVYGENDGLPNLIVDVYNEVLVVKLYALIWLPYLHWILPALLAITGGKTIVLRLSRAVQKYTDQLHGLQDGQVLCGAPFDGDVNFKEHGVRLAANVIRGHKTGFFLDHRHNRKRIGEMARGKTVLDVFSYAGGFSVHALMGGAQSVTSLDISAQALNLARQNVQLNDPNASDDLEDPDNEDNKDHNGHKRPLLDQHKTIAADAFEALEKMVKTKTAFDLVVIDPPSFAKRDSERDKAMHRYQQLAKLGTQLVKSGGVLMLASCSSRVSAEEFFEVAVQAFQKSKRKFKILEKTFHDIDHPVLPSFPEGAYLKSIYCRLG